MADWYYFSCMLEQSDFYEISYKYWIAKKILFVIFELVSNWLKIIIKHINTNNTK